MKVPQIKAELFISGQDFDPNLITDSIGINPTCVRKREDFPKASIDCGVAHTFWKWETMREKSYAVSNQMEEMLQSISGKEKRINELCKKYKLETIIVIIIHMRRNNPPEMVLSKEIVAFIASINAEIGFDMYID